MKLLKEYFELQQKIHEYFGYKQDWVVIPLEDRTDVDSWSVDEHSVTYFIDGVEFQEDIYTQRFLPKWVYRTNDYTMICVDTNTDGNKFLSVFDNATELKNG